MRFFSQKKIYGKIDDDLRKKFYNLFPTSNENSFKDFLISNKDNLMGHLNIDFNLFPFNINHGNIRLNSINLPI